MKGNFINIKKKHLLISQIDHSNNFPIKKKNIKRNYSTNYLRTITKSNFTDKINIKNNGNKESRTPIKENNIMKIISKPNIIKNKLTKFSKYFYFYLQLENRYNYKYKRKIKNLPTQELTGKTLKKKFELSKIISKIKENRLKKLKGNNINKYNYKKLHEALKMNKSQNILKQKYNKDDIIFNYINEDINSFYCLKNNLNNQLYFTNNSNSTKKLEKMKTYLSDKKSRNKTYYSFERNTLEKLSKMKTELKSIKFVYKIKDKNVKNINNFKLVKH